MDEINRAKIAKKVKLIYTIELIVFAVIFLAIGILEIVGVLHLKKWVMQTFNYVTIAGALFLIGDFLWALLSEKRRKKVCLLDKAILLPVAAFLIVFDIICFATDINAEQYYFRMYSMVAIFFYVAIAYLFQGIYHYFKPIPAITEAIEEAIEEASKPQIKEPVVNESAPEEEKKEEEKSTEE